MKRSTILKSLLSIVITASIFSSAGSITTVAARPNSVSEMYEKQQEYVELIEEYGKKWAAGLTNDETKAVKFYTNGGFQDINYYLRSNEQKLHPESPYSKSYLDQQIKLIDSAINKATLKKDLTVYRYTSEEEFKNKDNFLKHTFGIDLTPLQGVNDFTEYSKKAKKIIDKNIGKGYTALAYTSTSLLKLSGFSQKGVLVEITIPEGTHVPYISSISHFPDEKEFLLPRKTKFKITDTSIIQEGGRDILLVKATVVK